MMPTPQAGHSLYAPGGTTIDGSPIPRPLMTGLWML